MSDLKKFAKNSMIFLVGNVMIKLVSFLMLPIYTKYIIPEDYGTYDLNIAYITFFASIFFFDIWEGIMRFMFDYEGKKRYKPIQAGLMIFSASSILYCLFVVIWGNIFKIEYLPFLIFYGLLMNMQNIFSYIVRGLGKNVIYAISGLAGSLMTILSNILFIALLKKGYEFLYLSSCLGFITSIIINSASSHFFISLKKEFFDRYLVKTMLKYALPLSLNSIAYWFLTSYNKVVITNTLSNADNGLYAIASKFGLMLTIFTQCFQLAWQELSFSKAKVEQNEKSEFFSRAINEYINFLSVGIALLLPFIWIAFPVFVDVQYSAAKSIIPFYMIATLTSVISTFLGSVFSTLKKTKYIFSTTLVGSIFNVIVIHLTISFLGIQAASVALFVGFLTNCIMRIKVLNKFVPIKLDVKILLRCIFILLISTLAFLSNNWFVNILDFIIVIILGVYWYRDKIKGILFRR